MENTILADEAAKNLFAANTTHILRGNYDDIRADYTIDQEIERYTGAEHARWRFLFERQMALMPGFAAQEFIDGLSALNASDAIPNIEETNEVLFKATGWKLVAVPGLIPDEAFFGHLADKQFPVTHWIRSENELDYLVEPDIFHDFFGHVPLLLNPAFAKHIHEYGKGGTKAIKHGAAKMLARLYWYTVEFGLMDTPDGLRAFGAGILSSKDETIYSIENAAPNRIAFDLERVLRTDYMVDDFQKTYFVFQDFEAIFEKCSRDFAPFYERFSKAPTFDPAQIRGGDQIIKARTSK